MADNLPDQGQSAIAKDPSGIVIYDGSCAFCLRSIRLLRCVDWRKRLSYRTSQDPKLLEDHPALCEGACATGLRFIAPDHTIFIGADALRRICWQMPQTWIVACIWSIPPLPMLSRQIYGLIARNRHRL